MLEREREEAIIHLLLQKSFVSIHEIVKLTDSSEATIRRDFSHLEKAGRIVRVRGGAELSASEKNRQPNILRETPFAIRKDIHSSIKRKIAEAAVSTIKDGETIIIDGGSTTYQMVEFLASLELTIITNSFIVAEYLVKKGKSQIILPEGIIYPESLLILNPLQPDPFSNYHASKVFMGVEGINNDIIMNSRIELIQMEKSMINHADELVILADSSKFRSKGNLFLCNLDQVHTIITDDDISQEEAEQVRSKGIHLTTVPIIK